MSAQSTTKSRARQARRASGRPGPQQAQPPASEVPERAGSALSPGHLFMFGALAAASVGAVAVRDTSPANVIFVSLAIFAASAAGYTVYRTLWPLVAEEEDAGPEVLGGRTRAALEREKFLALRAIKDLEFDHAMGKVSEQDLRDMGARLRARAIRIIRQLDHGADGYRDMIERELGARLGQLGGQAGSTPGPAPAAVDTSGDVGEVAVEIVDAGGEKAGGGGEDIRAVCPACQAVNDSDARFCKQCGTRLPQLT